MLMKGPPHPFARYRCMHIFNGGGNTMPGTRFHWFMLLTILLLAGCSPKHNVYEASDLISLTHNPQTDFTLLVYRDRIGRTSQVLRRKGVVEFVLSQDESGMMSLKERGKELREIDSDMYHALVLFIDQVLFMEEAPPAAPYTSSTP